MVGFGAGKVLGVVASKAAPALRNVLGRGAAGETDTVASAAAEDAAPNLGPQVKFNRQTQYGGAQTNSPAGRAIREAAEGEPCPSCNKPMVSRTPTQPVPEHSPSLLEHYYEYGGYAMSNEERAAYAQSEEAFDGAMCLTCQRSQGAYLSQLSRHFTRFFGLE